MSIYGLIMVIITLGGGGDLLDLTNTASYWRVKGTAPTMEMLHVAIADPAKAPDVSADIEKLGNADAKVRAAARDALAARGIAIVDQLNKGTQNKNARIAAACSELLADAGGSQVLAIRKLMAIRTLGEMKDKDSIPALGKLTESKEPFVAEYAQRALDQINGASHPRIAPKIDDDINLLPKDTASLGQSRGLGSITLDKFLDAVPEMIHPRKGRKADEARNDSMDEMTRNLLKVTEMTGDLRLDGITVATSKDAGFGDDNGWVILVVRGKCDLPAVAEALASNDDIEFKASEQDHVKILATRGFRVLIPSDDLAVIISGSGADDAQKVMLAALKAGQGGLPQNADLAALLKQVDRSKDIWAILQVPPSLQRIVLFAGVDTLTLQANHKGDAVHFDVTGTGSDAEKIAASADVLKKGLAGSIAQGKDEVAELAANKSSNRGKGAMIERGMAMLQSVKIASQGKVLTVNGDFELLRQMAAYLASIDESDTLDDPEPATQPMPRN